MIVVDASAVLEVLLGTPDGSRVGERLFADEEWHAPQVFDLEVVHAIRRYVGSGQLSEHEGVRGIAELWMLPLLRHDHLPLVPRIWSLRENATAYDAAYLALAEALEAPLVTRDARLTAVPRHSAVVELL